MKARYPLPVVFFASLRRIKKSGGSWSRRSSACTILDGARVTLSDWRATAHPLLGRIEEFEGDILREEGNFGSAVQSWQKSIALQPKNRRVLAKIAAAEQRDGRWADAKAVWTQALEIRDNATARINRAVCYRRLRQWNEAFEDLHHAQKLGPEDADVQRWSKVFESLSKYLDEIRELDARVTADSRRLRSAGRACASYAAKRGRGTGARGQRRSGRAWPHGRFDRNCFKHSP